MTTVVNIKKTDQYDILVGRPTIFGNLWSHLDNSIAQFKVESREVAIENYRIWLKGEGFLDVEQERREKILDGLESLRGKILGCFCRPKSCHADVLIELLGENQEKKHLPSAQKLF